MKTKALVIKFLSFFFIFLVFFFSLVWIHVNYFQDQVSDMARPTSSPWHQSKPEFDLDYSQYVAPKSDLNLLVQSSSQKKQEDKKYPSDYKEKAYAGLYTARIKSIVEDKVIYDVEYSFDQHGRRAVKQSPKPQAEKFVLALGCSITLGEGLQLGQDFPSKLSSKLSEQWSVYNLGFHGFAPSVAYDRMIHHPKYIEGITERSGVFVWTFIPDQIKRQICPRSCYNLESDWMLYLPEVVREQDQLTIKKTFGYSFEPWRLFFRLLNALPVVNRLRFSDPEYSNEDIENFFFILDQLAFKSKKSIDKKYFIIYDDIEESLFQKIQASAQKFNFEIIYFPSYKKNIDSKHLVIPIDGHPSELAYELLSDVLAKKIVIDFK